MRLLPASLFGRLVAVLVGGLVLAVSIGVATYLRERSELLEQAGAIGTARQIADAIRVLEAQGPAAREKTAADLSSAALGVTLDAGPGERAPAAASGPYARRVASLLESYLGEQRDVRLGPGGPMPPMRMGAGMPPMAMMGAERMPHAMAHPLAVQVRLRDGTWATFSYEMRPPRAAWPVQLVLEAVALVLAVTVLSILAVRRATRPLAMLASAADELGANINRAPLPEEGPDEVRRAARAFNSMQTRLRGYIEDRGRILAAIAHDLKTPLALMRLRAESLPDEGLKAKLEGDLRRMERLVAETLDFVRALDSPEPARPVDVLALLESLKADTAALGWQVEVSGSARPYPGRVQALQRCIANLVENAVRYGKRARVGLEDGNEALRVRIRDEGPGISESELERVFEPFYRLEASRNPATGGVGLGLAIARTIARAHGGDVVLRNLEGGGLEALLSLPR